MEIIYADSDIIVLSKPPGMPVHGGDSVSGETAADILVKKFPELKTVGDDPFRRPGIVHRLDKDTSGIMVAARNQETFALLKESFKKRLIEKTYLALVCGRFEKKRGSISFPVGRLLKNPMKRGILANGRLVSRPRDALTEYEVLGQAGEYSFLRLRPRTGRTHQIRVHLGGIGRPVACDHLYGGKKVCCPPGVSRFLLHASGLSFRMPPDKRFFFEADLPQDFAGVLGRLGFSLKK
jgi:23S rRNA pseudouridine1911/1915/1917 synthase